MVYKIDLRLRVFLLLISFILRLPLFKYILLRVIKTLNPAEVVFIAFDSAGN